MNVAASVRKNREAHPEMYCKSCLWRVQTINGRKPCPTHMKAEIDAALKENEQDLAALLAESIALTKRNP